MLPEDATTQSKADSPSGSAQPGVVIIELFAGILPATAALQKHNVDAVTYFSEIANDPLEIARAR